MQVTLTFIRYDKKFIIFAFFAMVIHHIPLWLSKKISFYKLMGSGKNGSFDKSPDWQQWAILAVHKDVVVQPQAPLYGLFIQRWFEVLGCETCSFFLEAIEGHGQWDGQDCFGTLPHKSDYDGIIAILTRATIKISKAAAFWKNVAPVSSTLQQSPGFLLSFGIGEIPLIKQATFSIWKNKESMKNFAYQMSAHTAVIQKTRKQKWYSEEMFVRFRLMKITGTIRGTVPLAGII